MKSELLKSGLNTWPAAILPTEPSSQTPGPFFFFNNRNKEIRSQAQKFCQTNEIEHGFVLWVFCLFWLSFFQYAKIPSVSSLNFLSLHGTQQ